VGCLSTLVEESPPTRHATMSSSESVAKASIFASPSTSNAKQPVPVVAAPSMVCDVKDWDPSFSLQSSSSSV
jgi:hypothetical protein